MLSTWGEGCGGGEGADCLGGEGEEGGWLEEKGGGGGGKGRRGT